jgi:2'-hydroxyisoflavone reductase
MTSRRRFLRTVSLAAGSLGIATVVPNVLRAGALHDDRHAAPRRKSILVLGGTGFIGPHLVTRAVERGHAVSIFTRGRREATLPSSVERLIGDRDGKLEALEGRAWDVVIDDSATNPAWVRQSTELLAPRVGRYLFTSSTGVYYPYLRAGLTEADAVHTEARDPKDGSESFGTRKAQCEGVVREAFGDRGIVVRPTYIVGPGDYTDRFTYWPVRLARGGEVLAPGKRSDPVQFIDVRDLAAFMLTLVEQDASGIFNAVGPQDVMSIETFLTRAQSALGSSARFTWVSDYDVLAKANVEGMVPWILPTGNDLGHTSIRTTRAYAQGLACRDVEETVRDTLAWFTSLPAERQAAAKWALSEEKERALLDAQR